MGEGAVYFFGRLKANSLLYSLREFFLNKFCNRIDRNSRFYIVFFISGHYAIRIFKNSRLELCRILVITPITRQCPCYDITFQIYYLTKRSNR